MPEGMRCILNSPRGLTTVCPALFPPENLTTAPAFSARRSTIFPLPSSPHWPPMITIAGISQPFCLVLFVLFLLCPRLRDPFDSFHSLRVNGEDGIRTHEGLPPTRSPG